MALVSLRQVLDHAAEHGYGVPAFNMNNMEQGLAIMEAAEETKSPVILQASRGARAYANDVVLAKLIDALVEVHPDIPVCMHLVMHGSSSVPEELQETINKYGGQMKPTWGVPVEEIQRGIKHGVRKINIDTDNRMALTGAIRKVLTENPSEFDPRKYLTPAMAAMKKLCKERFEQFGTAGNAPKIKPIPLSDMAKRYKSGSLDPKFG